MAGKLQAVDGVYKEKLKVLLLLVKFLPMTSSQEKQHTYLVCKTEICNIV